MIDARRETIREAFDREPRHDLQAEAATLGAILTAPQFFPEMRAKGLRTELFHDPIHREVCAIMLGLDSQGVAIDEVTLVGKLREREEDLRINAAATLMKLVEGCAVASNWPDYLNRLQQEWGHRQNSLVAGELIRGTLNGRPASSIAEEAARSLERVRVGTTIGGKVLTYRRLTCAELDAAEYATEYLCEWLLVAGQPCIFAGGKKTLKTTLLCALCLALATGGYFLGKFRVPRAVRVCLMSGESGLATIQETLRRIAASMGFHLADIHNLIISDQLPIFGDLRHTDALRKFLTDNEIEVVGIDPAYLAMATGGNEGSLFAVGDLLRSVSELCQSIGVTMILAHHTRKNIADPFAAPELEDIAWAGFPEFARQWLLVSRREKYEPGTGRHRLWLNCGGSAGHSSLWALDVDEGTFDGNLPRFWQVELMPAKDARQDAEQRREADKLEKRNLKNRAQLDADKQAIVRAIGKFPEGETKSAVRDASGVRSDRFSAALAELLAEKTLVATTIIKGKNQRYEGYKLKPDSDENGTLGHTRTEHSDNLSDSGGTLGTDNNPIRGCPSDCVSPAQLPDCEDDSESVRLSDCSKRKKATKRKKKNRVAEPTGQGSDEA